MNIEKINPSLYKFTLEMGDFQVNMGVCTGEDGILLIDTGWIMTAEEVKEEIKKIDQSSVNMIIFTHLHGDHVGGRTVLGEDAVFIAHKNVQAALEGRYFDLEPLPGKKQPTILVEDQITININGEEIKLIPAPGHTNSDMIVHFVHSGVVFMGDLIFSDTFPAVFAVFGGHIDTLITTLTHLIDTLPEDIQLIAGHGRDYTLEELREYTKMIIDTSDLIKKELAAGKDAEKILEEGLLSDWEKWSTPVVTDENWIGFINDCLTGKAVKSVSEPLTKTIMDQGVEAAMAQYHDLKENQPDLYTFGENDLNMLGYNLMWREMYQDAIEILKLNVQVFPESANPCDSLAEVYEQTGDLARAKEYYQKALDIDPDLGPSKEGLDRIAASESK